MIHLPSHMCGHLLGFNEFWQRMRAKSADARIAQTAGSLTFTTLLSLVPLLTVTLTLMSKFTQFASLGSGLRSFLLENLLPDRAGKVITTYVLQFSQKASSLTLVGTSMLVVTAVMLLQTIDRTLNSIWAIRRPRPWWVRMSTYWIVLTIGPFVLAACIAFMSMVVKTSLGLVHEPAWVGSFANTLMPALLICGLFTYLFHKVPNRPMELRHSIIGGVVAALGVMLVQRLFGLYLSKLPNFTLIYGTFSVVPIFLVWLYFTWVAVLNGAVVAAVLPDFQSRHKLLPETPSGRIHAALRLVVALAEAQKIGIAQPLATLAEKSGQGRVGAEQMLDDMAQAGWAVCTEAGEWVLSKSAHTLSLGDVMAWLALGGGPEPDVGIDEQRVIRAALARLRSALDTPVASLVDEASSLQRGP
ncbi:YihY family inner membrane protein [Uliginosibacterium sp. H3]|uniref:YihY family inner membrane protein n=1 Tax=Uliginosibacterium silvisoli TaxID=3114758 RepID=A0ABU6K2E9_9RHOO|nr:YihY family inner membrane protein [Uliginosibacterium sp. H3]